MSPIDVPTSLSLTENSIATTLNITAPEDTDYSASRLNVTVEALPSNGTILLSDGLTPLTVGQNLTVEQLTALQLKPEPNSSGHCSTFAYKVSDPEGNTASATATIAIGARAEPGSDINSALGVALNISITSEAAAAVTIQVTQLPTDGTVALADGTPVSVGQILTLAQLSWLRFNSDPGGAPQSSQFSWNESTASGAIIPMAIAVSVDPTALGNTPAVAPAPTDPTMTTPMLAASAALATNDLARLRLRPTRHVAAHTKFDTFASSLAAQAKLVASAATPISSAIPGQGATQAQGSMSSDITSTGADPSGNTISASASPLAASSTTSLTATAINPVANGDPPGDYNSVYGMPLDIDVPSEAASSVTFQMTALPTNASVMMADGTPISAGQSLTPAQAAGLRIMPNGVAQNSELDWNEVVPGMPSIPRSISLPFDANTNSVALNTTSITPEITDPPTLAPAITGSAATASVSKPNPIILENEKPGTPQSVWEVGPGDDSTEIQGFTTSISTPLGGTVQFKIDNQTGNGNYQIQIYRLGYYGGDGATLYATIDHSGSPVVQPNPLTNAATGEVDAGNWSVTDSWAVPSTATSGVYVANVIDGSQIFQIPFVVTNPSSTSDIVFQTSDETWQAYNGWGGDNLYGGDGPANPPPSNFGQGAAFAVSYNRPIVSRDSIGAYAGPQDSLFGAEYAAIYWLEENGYNVSYISGIDTATNGSLLLNHKVFMDAGHDEYWTDSQVANVEAAANAGVNLAFFSGNELFWQTRLSPSLDSSATANRTLVTYKDTHFNQEIDPSGRDTGSFEDPRLGSPATPGNEVDGELFSVDQNSGTQSITIPYGETQLRIWRNTGVATTAPGGTASLESGLLGYEWDSAPNNPFTPASLIDLSSTTVQEPTAFNTDFGNVDTSGTATNSLVEYRDPTSGALVFGAGTVFWSWGLSTAHDNAPVPFSSTTTDPSVQQATVNLLADMGVQPQTLQASLVLATQSTDHTPPTSTISKVSTTNVVEGGTVTVNGTATDAGGGVVAGVEVSTDGGQTWNPATSPVGSASVNWTYSFTAPAPGTYTIESRAIDDSANLETPSDGVSYTVAPSADLSLFSSASTAPPIASDPKALEVGVKFISATPGLITGIRFYKGSANTGTHVGNLWSASGSLLATATFTNETAGGWQQVNFSSPVSIAAGTTYVASYHTNTGDYAATPYYFTAYTGQTDGSLNAPGDGLNGVYAYSSSSTFPNTTSVTANNFWVDVVFDDNGATPPVLGSVAASAAYTAGGAATTLSSGTTVSDPESTNLVSATVSITSGLLTGDTLAATTTGTSISQSYNASTGALTLSGSDTLAHYQQVLDSVSYSSSNPNPTNSGADASRTISWSVNDGTLSSAVQTTSVSITGSQAPPVLGNVAASASYTVGGTATTLSSGTTVSDAESANLVSATVSISSGFLTADTLAAATTGTSIGASYNTSTGALTLSGSDTLAHYQQVLDSVKYSSSNPNPTNSGADASRTISWSVNDGTLGSAVQTTSVSITGSHAPVLANVAASAAYTAGGTATTLSSGTTVSDPESTNLVSATVSISSGFLTGDTLAAATTGTSISQSYNASTGALTLSGSDTLAHYQQVLDSVSYSSSNPNPTNSGADASRTVSWAVNDGTLSSAAKTTTLNISGGSTADTLFSSSSAPTNVTENDPEAVDLGVKFQASASGTIIGIRFYKGPQNTGTHIGDLWSSSGSLIASATFTGETASGWQQVNFSSPVSITAGTTYIASYEAPIGEYSADQNYFTNALTNGPLTEPSSASSGGNGVYAYGSSNLFPNSSFNASNYWVDVVFSPGTTQSPPVLGNVAASAAYTVGGTATTLSSGTTVSDVESANLVSATVSISSGFLTGDTLAAAATGTSIGASYNTSTGALTLSGSDTLAHYQQVLDSVSYSSSNPNPTNSGADASRTVSWVVNDGTLSSTPQTTTVNITGSQAPVLGSVAASAAYTVGGTATTLSSGTTVSDAESTNLVSATVSITSGLLTGDTLAATTTGSITTSYNASTGVLTLTGSDTLAHYQQVLDSVKYSSSSQNPTNSGADASRTVSWAVNDGTLSSAAKTTTLNISGGPTTDTLFSSSATPTNVTANDPEAVDLGVKFQASASGTISGIRFYKGPQNTGTHIGDLWSSSGSLIASATFTNETASGWQQVNFSSPVSITAGTTYIASYHTNVGEYSADQNYFASSLTNGPLTAPSSGSSGGNGVYAYGSSNLFPNSSFNATNYWVDAVFNPQLSG